MVKDKLHDAMDSTIYMYGMAALDLDDPGYNMFLCDPSLECDTIVEPEFYVSRIQPRRVVLCCHCAGTVPDPPIELNTRLKAPEGPYSVVLSICKACMDSGCRIIVRNARANTAAKQATLDAKRARKVERKKNVNVEDASAYVVVDASNVVVKDASIDVVEDASNVVVDVAASSPRRSRHNDRTSSPKYS